MPPTHAPRITTRRECRKIADPIGLDHAETHVRAKIRSQLQKLADLDRSIAAAKETTAAEASALRTAIDDARTELVEEVDAICTAVKGAFNEMSDVLDDRVAAVDAAEQAALTAYVDIEPRLKTAVRFSAT